MPEKTEKPEETSQFYRPDEKKKVEIDGGIHIQGDLGPGSVIGSGSVRAQNISGGDINIYHVTSYEGLSWNDIVNAVDTQPLAKGQKEELKSALVVIRDEIGKGDNTDTGLVNILIAAIGDLSPEVLRLLTQWILAPDTGASPVIRLIARKTLKDATK